MNLRAVFLFGALLASPAWSQEPATNSPALTPRSFDLSNDSIKKIVRNTAASQSATVQLSEEMAVAREPVATVRYVPPVEPEPVIRTPPRPEAAPQRQGFLSALVETLIDDALGVDDDLSLQEEEARMLRCKLRGDYKPATPGFEKCPGDDP